MAKFWILQGSQYASATLHSEYDRICLHSVLNISWVLNMSGFSIWQSGEYEYAGVTQGSKYSLI